MKQTVKMARTSILALPLVMMGGIAFAGGLSEPIATPAPVQVVPAPVPVRVGSDWTGFYAGAQLGYGQLDSVALTEDPDGVTYGVHAGYLYDLGNIVLGAELDIDGTDIEDVTADVKLDSVTRAKLRLGYDAGDWLPYITAGVAQARTSSGAAAFDTDDTGGFAGLGVEYRVNSGMRVGGEVLQHQFNDYNDTGVDIDATTAALRVSFQF
ncbi:porin family protein [Yoonia sp.]|jgi:outer membrane immunogenic protein|uniref:outer membrane protein n=1 Tax=Yoonia sp. TaxID=2212373 RepID=UPI0025E61B0F|nr:porin family protein [Yoonia sp.]